MRKLIKAVLLCIALAVIVGCNNNQPDFRNSHWGDSKEKVRLDEQHLTPMNPKLIDNPFNWAAKTPPTKSDLAYETTLKSILMFNMSNKDTQKMLGDLFSGNTRRIPVNVGYIFDDQGLLRRTIIETGLHDNGTMSKANAKTLMNHALQIHGNPTSVTEHLTWLMHNNRRYPQLKVKTYWETSRSKILLTIEKNTSTCQFVWEYEDATH